MPSERQPSSTLFPWVGGCAEREVCRWGLRPRARPCRSPRRSLPINLSPRLTQSENNAPGAHQTPSRLLLLLVGVAALIVAGGDVTVGIVDRAPTPIGSSCSGPDHEAVSDRAACKARAWRGPSSSRLPALSSPPNNIKSTLGLLAYIKNWRRISAVRGGRPWLRFWPLSTRLIRVDQQASRKPGCQVLLLARPTTRSPSSRRSAGTGCGLAMGVSVMRMRKGRRRGKRTSDRLSAQSKCAAARALESFKRHRRPVDGVSSTQAQNRFGLWSIRQRGNAARAVRGLGPPKGGVSTLSGTSQSYSAGLPPD